MSRMCPNWSSTSYRSTTKSFKRPIASKRAMSTRSYREAVDCLNSLQSNAATLEAVRASGGRLSQFAIPEMLEYLGRIGYHVGFLSKYPGFNTQISIAGSTKCTQRYTHHRDKRQRFNRCFHRFHPSTSDAGMESRFARISILA
jgi:hypothetical protein